MSSMKCRCGSDDKLKVIDSVIVRIADNKSHICLGQESKVADTKFLENKQKEIKSEQKNEQIPKILADFCDKNYPRIKAFRKWIKDNDPTEAQNGQSLGLSLNQLNNQWIQEMILKK